MEFVNAFKAYLRYEYSQCLNLCEQSEQTVPILFIKAKCKLHLGIDLNGEFEKCANSNSSSFYDQFFSARAALQLYDLKKDRNYLNSANAKLTQTKKFLNEKDEINCFIKGWVLLYFKDYLNAIEAFKNAISLNNSLTDAYYYRGFAFSSLKQYDRSIADFEFCVKNNAKDKTVYKLLGHAYYRVNDFTKSAKAYDVYLRTAPNDQTVLIENGKAYFNSKNYDFAENCFTKALKNTPNDADLRFLRAATYKMQKNYAKAVQDLTKIIIEYPDECSALTERGNCYLALNRLTDAADDFARVMSINPQETAGYFNFGTAKMKQGELKEAIEYFTKVISIDQNDIEARLLRAKCRFDANDFESAFIDIAACTKIDSKRWDSYYLCAQIHIKRGNNELAAHNYNLAIQNGCNQTDAFIYCAKRYYNDRDFEKCIDLCEKCLKIEDSIEVLVLLAKASMAIGRTNNAIDALKKAQEIEPNNRQVKTELALALKSKGDFEAIASEFNQYCGDNPTANMVYAEACVHSGNLKDAEASYKNAVSLNPDNAVAHNNLGRVYQMQGKNELALNHFTQAIKINGNFSAAYNNRAVFHFEQANYSEAIHDYSEAIRLDPKNATYYYNRALAHEFSSAKKNPTKAIIDYQKALSLNPNLDNAKQALNNLKK